MKVAIVRDHDHGSVEASDGFEQNILGAQIEVVGGLVEQQESLPGSPGCGPGRSDCALRRRARPAFENIVAGEEEAAQQAAQLGLILWRGVADVVQHAGVGIEHLVLVLGKVFRGDIVAQAQMPLVGGSMPESMRIRVDFPAPFAPTSAMRSPRSMVKLTSSSTCFGP
jgi:hypothetical protein